MKKARLGRRGALIRWLWTNPRLILKQRGFWSWAGSSETSQIRVSWGGRGEGLSIPAFVSLWSQLSLCFTHHQGKGSPGWSQSVRSKAFFPVGDASVISQLVFNPRGWGMAERLQAVQQYPLQLYTWQDSRSPWPRDCTSPLGLFCFLYIKKFSHERAYLRREPTWSSSLNVRLILSYFTTSLPTTVPRAY